MTDTIFYAFSASLATAFWLGAPVEQAIIGASIFGPLVAIFRSSAIWLGGWPDRRRRRETMSLFDGSCPACDSPEIEVTSERGITCNSCLTLYVVGDDGLVTRRGKTAKQVQDRQDRRDVS